MSDTSITKGIEEEYSLDEEEPAEDNTSVALLSAARKSVNLPAVTNRTTNPALARTVTVNTRNVSKSKKKSRPAKESTDSSAQPRQAVNFLNSDKWSKELRPPHLEDDEVFNTLSVEVAANNIMQWMTTKAMIASNDIKEKRSRSMLGREKPDEKIKPIKIEAGLDDAESSLHKQRFSFRTPLKEPHEYWHLVPIKWQEVNKSIHLDHVGLDNICSPRTIELLHDRSSPLEIKMFMTMNINVGRAGIARKQNLRTLEDGTTEVVCADDWLSPTNINQLLEALDNMVAVWVIMWPGEWSMVALRRAVTKHLAFGDITNPDLRKRMLEGLINEILSSNASLAARGKPPMVFEKIDKLATRYLDNKKHFEKTFKIEQTKVSDTPKDQKNKKQTLREEVIFLKKKIGSKKTATGKDICIYYNTSQGCKSTVCRYEHACCWVKENGKDLCGGSHKKADHKKN
jgi:hypothetical protein